MGLDEYMSQKKKVLGFQVIIFPESGGYSVMAPGIGIADQGNTEEEALMHLKEGIELYMECLSPKERKELQKKVSESTFTKLNVEIPA